MDEVLRPGVYTKNITMTGVLNIPKKIRVSYSYAALDQISINTLYLVGDYEVDYSTKRLLINDRHIPIEVYLSQIEPYSQWLKLKFL